MDEVKIGQVWQHKRRPVVCWFVMHRTERMATIRRCNAVGGETSMYDRDIRIGTLVRDHILLNPPHMEGKS